MKEPVSQDPLTQLQVSVIVGQREQSLMEENMALREEAAKLRQQKLDLLFALHDAWPYVHQWCTIRTTKRRIEAALFGSPRTPL